MYDVPQMPAPDKVVTSNSKAGKSRMAMIFIQALDMKPSASMLWTDIG